MIDYNDKTFCSISNSSNGDVGTQTLFYYKQGGNIVTAEYNGGDILRGQLIAIVKENGTLDMRYHHVNVTGKLMTGVCTSIPEILADGRICLHETWQWTSGGEGSGTSIIEEINNSPDEDGKI